MRVRTPCIAALALLAGLSRAAGYDAEIRRTEFGIPHVKASDWGSLGYGYGHAQAEDNLCTLAEAFMTYRGQRSRHLGPDATPIADSTLGRPKNLESDFFFRAVADDGQVRAYRDHQPRALQELIQGYAAGYNRYLRELLDDAHARSHSACRSRDWLVPIDEDDIYRRLIALNVAGGLARFAAAIANAQPPQGTATTPPERLAPSLPRAEWQPGGRAGIDCCSAIRIGTGVAPIASIRRT